MKFSGWKELPEQEQREIARQWSAYDTSEQAALLEEIVSAFRAAYPAFDIPGTGNVHGSLMLVVLRPFIFDKSAAPEHFMGVPVRYTLNQPVPDGFQIHRKYIWAPENYLHFVEEYAADIRRELGNQGMTKEEMLPHLLGCPSTTGSSSAENVGLVIRTCFPASET